MYVYFAVSLFSHCIAESGGDGVLYMHSRNLNISRADNDTGSIHLEGADVIRRMQWAGDSANVWKAWKYMKVSLFLRVFVVFPRLLWCVVSAVLALEPLTQVPFRFDAVVDAKLGLPPSSSWAFAAEKNMRAPIIVLSNHAQQFTNPYVVLMFTLSNVQILMSTCDI